MSSPAALLAPLAVAAAAAAASPAGETVARRSPAPQPYAYVSGGKATDAPASAVDPMAGYVWDSPKAADKLQVYVMTPARATDKTNSGSFVGLDTASRERCDIRVNGTGTILVDFGVELPAWLEFDSPDLSGSVTCAVSEYNEVYRAWGNKTRAPKKVGRNTYRLVLNRELYEGLRFAFINVRKFDRPFTITAIRAVAQTYQPFTKADEQTKGVGLGLALAKRHALSLGGDMLIDTNYHDGCRITIEMPK